MPDHTIRGGLDHRVARAVRYVVAPGRTLQLGGTLHQSGSALRLRELGGRAKLQHLLEQGTLVPDTRRR